MTCVCHDVCVCTDQSISNELPTHPHHPQVVATLLLLTCHDSTMAAYD
jgi:hypothetical protein